MYLYELAVSLCRLMYIVFYARSDATSDLDGIICCWSRQRTEQSEKLANLAGEKLELDSLELLQSLPKPSDPLWTKSLICIPEIITSFLLKEKKVSRLEDLVDIRAQMSLQKGNTKESVEDPYVQTEYTRIPTSSAIQYHCNCFRHCKSQ